MPASPLPLPLSQRVWREAAGGLPDSFYAAVGECAILRYNHPTTFADGDFDELQNNRGAFP